MLSHPDTAINLVRTRGEVEVMSPFQAHQSCRIERSQRGRQIVKFDTVCTLLKHVWHAFFTMRLQDFDRLDPELGV